MDFKYLGPEAFVVGLGCSLRRKETGNNCAPTFIHGKEIDVVFGDIEASARKQRSDDADDWSVYIVQLLFTFTAAETPAMSSVLGFNCHAGVADSCT